MPTPNERNFGGILLRRLGENCLLADAATGSVFRKAQISDLIAAFAVNFLAAGLRPGDRLLVICRVTAASSLAYIAAMYAGIVPVLLDERTLEVHGRLLLERSGAKAIWTGGRIASDWAGGVLQFVGLPATPSSASLAPAQVADDDVAALMPTSGSTGTPVLVAVTHGNLRSNTEAVIRSQELGKDETAMLIMPVSYCFGASVLHTHLFQGGSVVFDSRFMFPDKVLRAVDAFCCTTFAGVPAVYNILLQRSNLRSLPLGSLRRLLQAGGRFSVDGVRRFCEILPGIDFFVMYGQTEATARISSLNVSRAPEKLGSVGLPLDNLEIRIADRNGNQLSDGQIGEICVRGPSICPGYFDDPESCRRKFVGGWLKTGDFGCLDGDGYLSVKGRSGDFIKIRGVRVGMGEIEERVAAVPGVSDCAAIGVEHPEAGEALALFVVAKTGEHSLAEKVRLALPPLWTCAAVNLVPELPRTTNGKIARAQLRALL